MRELTRIIVLAILLQLASVVFASENLVDATGRLQHLAAGNGWLSLRSDVMIPLPGWKKVLALSSARPEEKQYGQNKVWTATLGKDDNAPVDVAQSVRETHDGKLVFNIEVIAQQNVETEGVIFELDLPTSQFAGGLYSAGAMLGDLPLSLSDPYHLTAGPASTLVFTDAPRLAQVRAQFDRIADIMVQDARKWNDNFNVFVYVAPGLLERGKSYRLRLTLWGAGKLEEQPAYLWTSGKRIYRTLGTGGAYCFNIESPVSQYTMEQLSPHYARTEISLSLFDTAAENHLNDEQVDYKKLVATDQPDSRLRHEFELMRDLNKRKIPYISSIWSLPAWMYSGPVVEYGNKVPRERWPMLVQSIGAYLLYAHEEYHADPNYFSFNEPDGGVKVGFTPEEHRDFITMLGAHLRKLKLRTKMLAGDVTNPRNTIHYPEPALSDPEAAQYVGAISVHSWNGATPEQYEAWSALAKKAKLPLIVAEAGPDADWQKKPWESPDAYVNEMTHYMDVFRFMQPHAVLYWEYTEDYSLLNRGAKPQEYVLTERFCIQKHWADLVPAGSEAIQTYSNNEHIQIVGFQYKPDKGDKQYTFHIANPYWARKITLDLSKISSIKSLNMVRTAKGELYNELPAVSVADHTITLDLPAKSFTSLTTLPIKKIEPPK